MNNLTELFLLSKNIQIEIIKPNGYNREYYSVYKLLNDLEIPLNFAIKHKFLPLKVENYKELMYPMETIEKVIKLYVKYQQQKTWFST